jgi:hypothetical protein
MLSLPRCRSITTEEFERVTGNQFSDERFAALCNAIALSTRGRTPASLVAFTEHTQTLPGGIASDWQVELYEDRARPFPLLGPGLNAVECRRVPTWTTERNRLLAGLLAQVGGAVQTIVGHTGCRPHRYVLFTNLRLSQREDTLHRQLERSIMLGYEPEGKLQVEIVGAERLVELVNQYPYVRSAFFDDNGVQMWNEGWHDHVRPKLFGAHVGLVGRRAELAQLRSMLSDPAVRVIVLSGPRYSGKTRVALDATAHWQRETVLVNAVRLSTAHNLRKLAAPGKEVVVIADNCDSDQTPEIAAAMAGQNDLKVILLLQSSDLADVDLSKFGPGVREMYLGPMPEKDVNELLEEVVAGLDAETRSWIVREADGNPGIVLAAADLRHRLKRSAPSLLDALVLGMEFRIQREFGEHGVRILRLLSLMTEIDTSDDSLREIGTICNLVGDGLQPQSVLRALPRFKAAGVVSQAGRYVEVVPTFLANHLALDVMHEHPEQTGSLVSTFGPTGRLRLMRSRHRLVPDFDEDMSADFLQPAGLVNARPRHLRAAGDRKNV